MTKSLSNISSIKQSFNKVAGKLIEEFFEFDIPRATQFQAGLVALKLKDAKFNAYAVKDEEELTGKLLEAEIDPLTGSFAEAFVNSQNAAGVMRDVPPLGDIGVKLKLVDVKNKDLLMQVQGAIRTLDAIDALESGSFEKQPDLRSTVYDLRAESRSGQEGVEAKFARNFIGFKSPRNLTSAQALNHLADTFAANYEMLGARDMQPAELNYTLSAFRYMATKSLMDASREFEQVGHKHISVKLDAIIESLSARLWRTFGLDVEKEHSTKQAENIQNGMEVAANLLRGDNGVNKADLLELIKQRVTQVIGVEVSKAGDSIAR